MALKRGQTRPTQPITSPLFLPLSPRKFEGFAGTKLELKMAKKMRPSKAAAAAAAAAQAVRASPIGVSLESGRAPSPGRDLPQPTDGGHAADFRVSTPWLEQASTAAGSHPFSPVDMRWASPEMGAATVPLITLSVPVRVADVGAGSESVMRGSRSQALHPLAPAGSPPAGMLTVGADLRCYTPGSSKFISVA